MKVEAPPGRYRIVEKDRRLVTIDTQTGERIGVSAAMADASDLLSGADSASRASIAATSGSSRPSALGPVTTPGTPGTAKAALAIDQTKLNRILILAAAASVALVILIATGTWFLLILPFLVPQVRQTLWPKLKAAVTRWINQAG